MVLFFVSLFVTLTLVFGKQSPASTHSYSIHEALKHKYRASLPKPSKKTSANGYNANEETICIMTRDNICLSTKMYTPPKALYKPPYDVLYAKTPYGKNSLDADAAVAEPLGWVFLGQDVRGRGESNGSYSFWRTSGNDTMDTMEWVLNQNWSSGNIGSLGISANALAQYADLIGVTQFPVGSPGFIKYD
eukprot:218702_1